MLLKKIRRALYSISGLSEWQDFGTDKVQFWRVTESPTYRRLEDLTYPGILNGRQLVFDVKAPNRGGRILWRPSPRREIKLPCNQGLYLQKIISICTCQKQNLRNFPTRGPKGSGLERVSSFLTVVKVREIWEFGFLVIYYWNESCW